MMHSVVSGLSYGDCGKGSLIDILTEQHDVVVRFNAGANAGHGIKFNDKKYAVHLLPSGVFWEDKINVLGNGMVIDPIQLKQEIEDLQKDGIEPNVYVSDRAHVVLSWHKFEDQLQEKLRVQLREQNQIVGTTAKGIGPCYADKMHRSTAIRMCDIQNQTELSKKLKFAATIKNAYLKALSDLIDEPFSEFDPKQIEEDLTQSFPFKIADTRRLLQNAHIDGKRILFEGANASLLDIDQGVFPYTTSSNTTACGGIASGTGFTEKIHHVYGVAKAYVSRSGGGPVATEFFGAQADHIREIAHEYGTTTGRPRRIAWLDLVALKEAIRFSGVDSICLTGLGILSQLDSFKACVGYSLDGFPIDYIPADSTQYYSVVPNFIEMKSCGKKIDNCRNFEDLPSELKKFVYFVERVVRTTISSVCVGPERKQIIWRNE